MLTKEKTEVLASYLLSDEKQISNLTELPAEEVLAQINQDGYDFTVNDLKDFAEGILHFSKDGTEELSNDQLETVVGGSISVIAWPLSWLNSLPTISPTPSVFRWLKDLLRR